MNIKMLRPENYKKQIIIYGILGLVIILLVVNGELIRSSKKRAERNLINQAEMYADLKKEKDGLYSNLVDTQVSNKALKDSIESQSDEMRLLYKTLRRNKETIIELQDLNLSLQEQLDTTTILVDTIVKDSIVYIEKSFELRYPKDDDWFIKYSGRVDKDIITGKWTSGQLNVRLVKSKTQAGLTRVHLSGPSWLIANEVNVMTADKPEPINLFRFWIGGGWASAYDNAWRTPTFKAAVDIKRKFLVNGTIGANYYELGLLYGL